MKRFRLSLDDFGTGYSSLAQLRDISFDELKVDLSFVHGAGAIPKMQAIVEGSQRIAQQLGMTVVAEGVEDREIGISSAARIVISPRAISSRSRCRTTNCWDGSTIGAAACPTLSRRQIAVSASELPSE